MFPFLNVSICRTKTFQFWNSYCEMLSVQCEEFLTSCQFISWTKGVTCIYSQASVQVSVHRQSVADIVQASRGIETKQKQKAITL